MEQSLERKLLKEMLREWVEERLRDFTRESRARAVGATPHEVGSLVLELLAEVVEDLRKAEQEEASS